MRISFELAAEFREAEGKGASRRLRHAGRVPAILYGGSKDPRAITLNHQKLMTLVDNEKFYSSIINLKVGDVTQAAIVKDLQMHPARNAIQHLDMQRVVETEHIRIHIPIHFKGEAASPGVKSQGGVVSHRIADVEIACLP
jgi:large subunit ribosomal protein L25